MKYARLVVGRFLFNLGFHILPQCPAKDLLGEVLDRYRHHIMKNVTR